MGDLFFIIRTLVFSILLIFVFQISVGGYSLEQHSLRWIHESYIGTQIKDVAQSGAVMVERGFQYIKNKMNNHKQLLSKPEIVPGLRDEIIQLKRSAQYKFEEEKKKLLNNKKEENPLEFSSSEDDLSEDY